MLPLVDEGPSSSWMWHRGPAVHAGFSASWHAGLKTSVVGLITEAVCSSAEQASKMTVFLAGTLYVLLIWRFCMPGIRMAKADRPVS